MDEPILTRPILYKVGDSYLSKINISKSFTWFFTRNNMLLAKITHSEGRMAKWLILLIT
jgi:hypothetical protein